MKAHAEAIQKLKAARHLKAHSELKPHLDALLKYVDEIENRERIRPKKMEPPPGMEERFSIRAPIGFELEHYRAVLDVTKEFLHDFADKPEVNRLKPVSYVCTLGGVTFYIKCHWGVGDVARITVGRKPWTKTPIISSMSAETS